MAKINLGAVTLNCVGNRDQKQAFSCLSKLKVNWSFWNCTLYNQMKVEIVIVVNWVQGHNDLGQNPVILLLFFKAPSSFLIGKIYTKLGKKYADNDDSAKTNNRHIHTYKIYVHVTRSMTPDIEAEAFQK